MAEPYISQISIFGFQFSPSGWAFCDGAGVPIEEHPSLYSLITTTYGGDGRTYFKLPDLRGRVPIHRSHQFQQGTKGGSESVRLNMQTMPLHTHAVHANSVDGTTNQPSGMIPAKSQPSNKVYSEPRDVRPMFANTVTPSGEGEPHENVQPSLVVNFCIALSGVYPSRQ